MAYRSLLDEKDGRRWHIGLLNGGGGIAVSLMEKLNGGGGIAVCLMEKLGGGGISVFA